MFESLSLSILNLKSWLRLERKKKKGGRGGTAPMVSSQPQQTHIYHSMSEAVNEAEQPAQPPVAEQSSNKQLVVEGQTVTLVTAGVGRGIQTSSIWKYLVEFEQPVGAGNRKRNVKCMVKRTLPASGLMQERQVVCGHLMKYSRKDKNTSGTGTTGLWSHFEKHHKEIYDAEMKVSPSSTQGQKRKALLISGESGVMDFFSALKKKILLFFITCTKYLEVPEYSECYFLFL